MFCPKCGKENNEGENFCVACGTQFENSQPVEQKQVEVVSTEPKKCSKAKSSFWTAIVGLIIAGIICGTYAIVSGIQALKELDASKEMTGKGMATAGIVIGVLDVILSIMSIAALF